MKKLIMIMCILGIKAEAQWSNCWPAWEYPRKMNTQLDNLSSSVLERCHAFRHFNTPLAPTFWRFDRTVLTNLKGNVVYMLDGFDYTGWINTNGLAYTNALLVGRYLRTTSIYERARIPTNYFTYTPWRGLNGVGGYTNDPTVGHPHGWTNEYTVAGGTNYPAGRTNWYTTDYGMDELRRVVSNLTVFGYDFPDNGWFRATMETNISDWTDQGLYLEVTNVSWDGAVTALEAAWSERAATTNDAGRYWYDGFGRPNANVARANTNAYSDPAYIDMWGGYAWSFVFPWEYYFTNGWPLAVRERAFSADMFTAWQGTNWFGYPGAMDEITWWERIEVTNRGITTNIYGATLWNQSIDLPTTFTNQWGYNWVTVGTNNPSYDSNYDKWENDGFVWIVTYDFDYK
jgi:hypothetical protein